MGYMHILTMLQVIELLTVLLAQRVPNSQKDCGIKVKICVPESDDAPINRWFHIEGKGDIVLYINGPLLDEETTEVFQ